MHWREIAVAGHLVEIQRQGFASSRARQRSNSASASRYALTFEGAAQPGMGTTQSSMERYLLASISIAIAAGARTFLPITHLRFEDLRERLRLDTELGREAGSLRARSRRFTSQGEDATCEEARLDALALFERAAEAGLLRGRRFLPRGPPRMTNVNNLSAATHTGSSLQCRGRRLSLEDTNRVRESTLIHRNVSQSQRPHRRG